MKIPFTMVCLLAAGLLVPKLHVHAAGTGVVNLVNPVTPPPAVDAIDDGEDAVICENGLVLQKDGKCCPDGTSNNLWSGVCTPIGIINDQIFNYKDIPRYCPSADMFIVSDKNRDWFSCADRDSIPMYPEARGKTGSNFCIEHGYGYLLKINPWGTVGCIQVGDSQGDGCIEAGTCSFKGK